MAIVSSLFILKGITEFTFRAYIVQFMETQTQLSRHNKFISAENIIAILSISSDDSLHVSLPSQSSKCGVTACIQKIK